MRRIQLGDLPEQTYDSFEREVLLLAGISDDCSNLRLTYEDIDQHVVKIGSTRELVYAVQDCNDAGFVMIAASVEKKRESSTTPTLKATIPVTPIKTTALAAATTTDPTVLPNAISTAALAAPPAVASLVTEFPATLIKVEDQKILTRCKRKLPDLVLRVAKRSTGGRQLKPSMKQLEAEEYRAEEERFEEAKAKEDQLDGYKVEIHHTDDYVVEEDQAALYESEGKTDEDKAEHHIGEYEANEDLTDEYKADEGIAYESETEEECEAEEESEAEEDPTDQLSAEKEVQASKANSAEMQRDNVNANDIQAEGVKPQEVQTETVQTVEAEAVLAATSKAMAEVSGGDSTARTTELATTATVPVVIASTIQVASRTRSKKARNVHEKICDALMELRALHVTEPPRIQVALFAGYSNTKSTGFVKACSQLKKKGFLEYPGSKTMRLSNLGAQKLPPVDPPRDNAAVQARLRVMLQGKGKGASSKADQMFEILSDGKVYSRQDVATAMGYSNLKSTGFVKALSILGGLGLAIYPNTTSVQLTDIAFPYGRR